MDEQSSDCERGYLDHKEVYRQILDAIADMVLVKGAQSRILWANKAFRDYYGMTNEQLRDLIDAPFNEVDFTAQYVRDDLRVFTTGAVLNIPDEPVTRHDGLVQIFHTVKSPIRDQEGQIRMTVGVSRNITEQKRIKEDLDSYRVRLERLVEERTSELRSVSERNQIILASLSEGIIAVNAEGSVQLLNPAAETLIGMTYDQARGRNVLDILNFAPGQEVQSIDATPAVELGLQELLSSTRRLEGQLRTPPGSQRLVSIHTAPLIGDDGSPLGSVIVIRDIALEREVAGQRLRSQKLESVGVLAGGIAHDFNNLLAIILGSVSIASLGLERGENVLDVLADAKQACLRAQGLTTQLLTFSRGGAPVKKVLNLGPVVQEAASLALRGSMVELRLEFSDDLYLVEADEGQVSQAINNLVINAKQAMPRGGLVTIRLQNATASDVDGLPIRPGPYALIRVIDTGSGIAPEYVNRVFDPYFTTKETGSGLGLASVHSIIQRHGGYIFLRSMPQSGTSFTVLLPAARHQTTSQVATSNSNQLQKAYHVLVLDDDEGVRRVMATTLRHLGHRVVATGRSVDAFEAFTTAAAQGDPFNVVFVDLTMPGDLGGAQVARDLRDRNPEVKIVVMSGYSTDPVMAQARELGMVGALQKPFTIDMVREILSHC